MHLQEQSTGEGIQVTRASFIIADIVNNLGHFLTSLHDNHLIFQSVHIHPTFAEWKLHFFPPKLCKQTTAEELQGGSGESRILFAAVKRKLC